MDAHPSRHRSGRPLSVTLLALAVFILAAFNLTGLIAGWVRWPVLAPLNLTLPLWMLLLWDGIWGVLWLIIAGGLWRLAGWARRLALIAFPLYAALTVGREAFFAKGDYERGRLPFVIATAAAFGAWGMLTLLNRGGQRAFQHDEETNHQRSDEEHDDRSQD